MFYAFLYCTLTTACAVFAADVDRLNPETVVSLIMLQTVCLGVMGCVKYFNQR